jgi:DNA-binding transcriptional regulator YiaG
LDREKTVMINNNTKRRTKKQTIEKKTVNKITLKIINWTNKCIDIEIKKIRNKREHITFRGFPTKSH